MIEMSRNSMMQLVQLGEKMDTGPSEIEVTPPEGIVVEDDIVTHWECVSAVRCYVSPR